MTTNSERVSRRDFLKVAAKDAAVVGVGVGAAESLAPRSTYAAEAPSPPAPEYRNRTEGMEYRRFGRTRMMLSTLGVGGAIRPSEDMYLRFLDAGINYVQWYGDAALPRVLKKHHDRLFVIAKGKPDTLSDKQQLRSHVDGILTHLGVDSLDILDVNAPYSFMPEYLAEAVAELKEAGKLKALTRGGHRMAHEDVTDILPTFAKVYDGTIGGYCFAEQGTMPLDLAQKLNVGLIAFKPHKVEFTPELLQKAKAQGIDTQQASVRWVLAQPGFVSIIRAMRNVTQLESNLVAVRKALSEKEKRFMGEAGARLAATTCRLCEVCSAACPNGVRPSDMQRTRLYAEVFDDLPRASAEYARLGLAQRAAACVDCGACEEACPRHLPIRETIRVMSATLA